MSRQYSYLKYTGINSVFRTKAVINPVDIREELHPRTATLADNYTKGLSITPEGLVGSNSCVKGNQSLSIIKIPPEVFGESISAAAVVIELMDFYLFEGQPKEPIVPSHQKMMWILSHAQSTVGQSPLAKVTESEVGRGRNLSLYLTEELSNIVRSHKTIVDIAAMDGVTFIVYE